MTSILQMFGREPRHGLGAYTVGRRATDPDARAKRHVVARVEAVERRLDSYQHVRFPR